MYALIDTTPFHWNISTTAIPEFPARFALLADGTNGAELPYSRDEILTITAKHSRRKHYHDTGTNICRAVFDTLDAHVGDEFKSPPASAPGTVGWNSTMLPNDMFEQLMLTYGKPTPDAVRQNNMTFYSAYNPKDPPEVLFKRFADCQEIAIVAGVPFTTEQLLMNAVDLLTRCGLYARDMDDWERKPIYLVNRKIAPSPPNRNSTEVKRNGLSNRTRHPRFRMMKRSKSNASLGASFITLGPLTSRSSWPSVPSRASNHKAHSKRCSGANNSSITSPRIPTPPSVSMPPT
jgi:hypothetical protein